MTSPLKIVGGVYKEACVEPSWNAVFGSAGRAAAAVQNLVSGPIELHAYIAPEVAEIAAYLAADCGAKLVASPADYAVGFEYFHPLSTPVIHPPLHLIHPHAPIRVSGDVVLRFGILEGDAIVDAKVAIYDPQSAFGAVAFGANGSKAGRLAIILNRSEAAAMTGCQESEHAARHLIEKHGAAVTVVKMGGLGALVATADQSTIIPAYQSQNVWKIGSGDVFSGVFAALWGVSNLSPFEAAELASRAVSSYCDTRMLPSPSLDALRQSKNPALRPGRGRIYLAGPFFDIGQRWLIEEARRLLRDLGADVFSPLHAVGPGPAEIVAPADIHGIEESDAMFAILNGLDPGTIFEIGYAVKKGIPVVVLAQNIKDEDCKMIAGSGCTVFNDFTTALYHAVWQLPAA